MLFGVAFIAIKGYEWHHEYDRASSPAQASARRRTASRPSYKGDRLARRRWRTTAKGMQMFFVFYFTITGLHALHMIVGLGVLGVQLVLALRSRLRRPRLRPDRGGRAVLALRRYRVDLRLPAAVPAAKLIRI